MGTQSSRELVEAIAAAVPQRTEERFQSVLTGMPLDQLRKSRQMTQLQVASKLGVHQSEVSKIEHRSDLCISTLAQYVQAIGGRMEIRAVFDDREVRVSQFERIS
jgi:transcriptional regulator with XRE-family HTH domain